MRILLSHPMVYVYCLALAVLLILALFPRRKQARVGSERWRGRGESFRKRV